MAASLATADICDERGDEVVVLQGPFIDFGGKKTFSGRLVIVRSFEDNVLAGKELEKDGRGKVLLIDGGGSLRCALFGDMSEFGCLDEARVRCHQSSIPHSESN